MDKQKTRLLITGGRGFLGRHLERKLRSHGWKNLVIVDKDDYDLVNPLEVRRMLSEERPNAIIHLAAVVGGIGANREHPGKFFYENAVMGIHLIEESRLAGVEKLVVLGTICAYPKFTPVPFREENLWDGYPEETNAPYGIAKKALLVQLQSYRAEYGFNGVFLLPVNLYGPGDNFDPRSSHVIPALIRKCLEARAEGKGFIEVWGTGSVSREFIYVEDAAEGIALATEHYNDSEPVNIGAGFEIKICELVWLIARLCGFEGEIRYNPSYPDGQPRRMLDTTKAEKLFGFRAKTSFEEGLRKTIEWYREQRGF
ncbi:MAG: GDP-L-fucose synthase [Planctomycetota bacterium]